jgi:hypothetical protein
MKDQKLAKVPSPPMSAPDGLARHFWGNASANEMPATSSREQSPPYHMAVHRILRLMMAPASAKMPAKPVSSRVYDLLTGCKFRGAECADTACRRQAALQGASRTTRPQMICTQHRCAKNNRRVMTWRVTELYDAQWRRRRRRCREVGLLGGSSVGPCPDF